MASQFPRHKMSAIGAPRKRKDLQPPGQISHQEHRDAIASAKEILANPSMFSKEELEEARVMAEGAIDPEDALNNFFHDLGMDEEDEDMADAEGLDQVLDEEASQAEPTPLVQVKPAKVVAKPAKAKHHSTKFHTSVVH